jgi:hypothetical protein
MLGAIMRILFESIANRFNIPIGAIVVMYLVLAVVISIDQIAFALERELWVGVSLWLGALIFVWFCYGRSFWERPSDTAKRENSE